MFEECRTILFVLANSEIKGRKRFHKSVYLLKEAGLPVMEKFEWNNFGPFSKELASEIDALCEMGLVEEEVYTSDDIKEYSYRLTEKGREIAGTMISSDTPTFNHIKKMMLKLNEYEVSDLEKMASIRFLLMKKYGIEYMSVFLNYAKGYQKKDVINGKKAMEELLKELTVK